MKQLNIIISLFLMISFSIAQTKIWADIEGEDESFWEPPSLTESHNELEIIVNEQNAPALSHVSIQSSGDRSTRTYVPDDNFEQALIDLGYDSVLDDSVLTANISGVTSLSVNNKEISDLTGIQSFTALTYLSCRDNNLTALDVSNNTALTSLSCYDNQLTALDVSANTALVYLYCYDNQLTALDVSANTALVYLYCHYNQLTALDVSANTALEYLYCYGSSPTSSYGLTNQINELDISNNTALTNLRCSRNGLMALDVTSNTALTYIDCSYNNLAISGLDVSANTALINLYCYYNELISLDVSNNTALDYLACSNNNITSLDVSNNTVLRIFYGAGNDLATLDVSNNPALETLSLGSNYLSALDVSNNPALTYIYCGYNNIEALDVSNNTALTNLSCASNQFTTLDVSANTGLTRFLCGENELTVLDVSNNPLLENFRCDGNLLTTLDISNNPSLETFYCNNNQFTSLDVSIHSALEKFRCYENLLTSLDVSENTALTELNCSTNQLTYLNMRNGVTEQLTSFNARYNPDLTCIETLDPVYATANWTNIDAGVTFSTICSNNPNASSTYVPDDNFEQALIDLGYDSVLDDSVLTTNISGVDSLDVSGKSISDLTGIEDFSALTKLNCKSNALTSLDVSSNTALNELKCQYNQLTSLDVSQNTALTLLNCGANDLDTLDVSNNTALITLNTFENNLTSLEISTNTAIETMYCYDNQLTSLDVSGNTALTFLNCRDNNLTELDVSANTALTTLYCYNNELTSLGLSGATALTFLNCYNNDLTVLDVTNNTALTTLICRANQLTALDLSNNTNLTDLRCQENLLTSIDLSSNTALTKLSIHINQLTSLDLSANTALTDLNVIDNPDLYCIQVADVAQAEQNWGNDLSNWMGFSMDCSNLVFGCTDSFAQNYNPDANWDTGSCTGYPDNGEYNLSFDGVDDYIDAGSVSNNFSNADFTINAWVKTSAASQGILIKNDGDGTWEVGEKAFYIQSSGIPAFVGWGNNYIVGDVSINDGNWHYVSIVWDYSGSGSSGTGKVFVDGVEGTSSSGYAANNLDVGGHSITIGAPNYFSGEAPNYFSGNINDVTIWDRALTQEEIQSSMSFGLSGDEDGLQGYWKFDAGADTIAYDHSGNANHGDIIGASWDMPGCTDPYAGNYDSTATSDDGSCTGYPDNGEYDLSFDGVDDYVKSNWNQSQSMDNYTVTIWIKSEDLNQPIHSAAFNNYSSTSNGFQISVDSSDPNIYRFHSTSHDLNFGTSSTEWVHLAVTANGDSTKVYYNGNLASAGAWVVSGWDQIVFGRNRAQYEYGEFKINECSVWNNALTQEEIQSSMHLGLSGDEDGLIGYWKFNAGADTIAYDHSGNASHGDIHGASWSVSQTYVPDDKFEQVLIDLGYDDVLDDYVVTDNINSVTYLDVTNDSISDLTGIEDFTSLTTLKCVGNELTSLDMSGNTALTFLNCYANNLTSLNVSNNPLLDFLWCQNNQLTSLDVSNNTLVTELMCHSNSLDSLDLATNTMLEILRCNGNQFTTLDLSNNTALKWIWCQGNQLTSLDFSNNVAIETIRCNSNSLSSINISNNPALKTLHCYSNQLTNLEIVGKDSLYNLDCRSNALTSLDLSGAPNLTTVNCWDNDLISLNLSANDSLAYLNCDWNALPSLDVSNNSQLETLKCNQNSIGSLDLSNNIFLTTLSVSSTAIDSLDLSNNTSLTWLGCNWNSSLSYLNMKNGLTQELTNFQVDNTNLTCIEVLDPEWSTENWTYANGNIDDGVTFSVICGSQNQDEWYVATTGSDGSGNGTDDSPFASIQTGINAAGDGDSVYVAVGTYIENINFRGKNIWVLGEERETTIIDGNDSASVVIFNNGENYTAHLSGFTLTNGLPNGAWPSSRGGAINCQNASPTLSNLLITGNSSTAGGGGIYLYSGSNAKITDVIIKDNVGGWGGGGMYIEGSDAELTNVHIHSNDDGGVKLQASDVSFNHVTISDNESYGMHIEYSEPTFNHTTIVNNDTYGVGLFSTWSHPVITNSIIANNGTQVKTNHSTGPYGISISYSNIQGGLDELDSLEFDPDSVNWDESNIDFDPLFCEPDSGNYHIAENSPSAGTGENGADMGAFGVGCDDIWLPPVITAIADTSMDEDSELVLQLSAQSSQGYDIYFEAQSDTPSVYAYTNPGAGGGSLTITLMTDWNGSAEITVVAYSEFDSDINDTTSFALTVNPVDDLPFVDGHILPRNYPEDFGIDTVAYLPDVFTDIDGQLTYSYSFTDTSVLSAGISRSYLILSSLPDAYGDTEIMVTAMNPTRASVTDTVLLNVWAINDAPVVSIPDTMMNEDSEFFYDVSDYISDVDSENLMVGVDNVSQPMREHVQAQMIGPDTLHLVSQNNWNGTGTILMRVDDGQMETHHPFVLTVNPVNDAPVFENLSALVGMGMEFEVPIHVSDVDMDSLTVTFDASWEYPTWLSLVDGPYRLVGTPPVQGQLQFPLHLSDRQVTVTDTFSILAAFFHPRITSITDVPDDQGGRVYIDFRRSFFDESDQTGQTYTVFRRDMIENTPDWVVVGSGAAIGDDAYTYEVTTLKDSTADDNGMTQFKVVASMNEGHFHSPSQSGYSIDNIAPGVPTGMQLVANNTTITVIWNTSGDDDFQYFLLERGIDAGFSTNIYTSFEVVDTVYTDEAIDLGQEYFYRLAAIDHAGNKSNYTQAMSATALAIDPASLIPEVFALHQNYPNPFNPVTQIRYDLPKDSYVSITIYDIMGRNIKSLVNTKQAAGYRSIRWNATNDFGEPVSAGMYIYMIQAGEFRQTKKMVLLK